MSLLKTIESEIAVLPPNLQAELLEFVQFVKQRHGLPAVSAAPIAPDVDDSPFFQALDEAGLVGCIETDEQLAATYKSQIDFSSRQRKPAPNAHR